MLIHSCYLLFDHFQFALINGSNIPGSYVIVLFKASDLASITSHIHNWLLFLLWRCLFILCGVISPLISSSILGTYWPGEFVFQCPVFLPFHTVYGVLKARILKWLAIPFSSGPRFVRTLHHDLSILGGPTWHGSVSLSYTRLCTMWSDWLVFCHCDFSLSALLWRRITGLWKFPDGRDWLRGELGLVLMGGSMLSKYLIQFSVDGWGYVPSLLFDLRPNYGGGNEDNGDLLQKVPCRHCYSVSPTLQRATANPLLWPSPLLTHTSSGDTQTQFCLGLCGVSLTLTQTLSPNPNP